MNSTILPFGLAFSTLLLAVALWWTWRSLYQLRLKEAEQQRRQEDIERRLQRLQMVSEAQEEDERVRHDEDIKEVLESFLEYNESLRKGQEQVTRETPATGREEVS